MFNDQLMVQEFLADHPLLTVVLERFNIDEHTNYQEIKLLSRGAEKEVSFLLEVYCMFENEQYFPEDKFQRYSMELIINYLQQTHQYYLDKRLPGIEQSLNRLIDNCPDASVVVLLKRFYQTYSDELVSHISIEEDLLFPYIAELKQRMRNLRLGPPTIAFSIKQFAQAHDHTLEHALTAICHTIEQKHSEIARSMAYRMFASQLQLLQKDLHVHEQIENDVLLPRAAAIEQIVCSSAAN